MNETMVDESVTPLENLMTEETKSAPVPVQVLAARVRMKADRRLKRDSPTWIKELSAAGKRAS